MGVPLATDEALCAGRKRGKEAEQDEALEPEAVRARLENICESAVEFDVCELFSPPRVTLVAKEAGLKSGYSLDCNWHDQTTNRMWNLLEKRDQSLLWGVLRRRPTRLLIASPPCTIFSSLQKLRKTPMPEDERQNGLELLKVAVRACLLQVKSNNLFIFEHPAGATSWNENCLKELGSLKRS